MALKIRLMKTKHVPFPADSLAARYLPADYADAFECVCPLPATVTPDDVQAGFWITAPKWVEALMKLRNRLVRPFGLEGGNSMSREEMAERIRQGTTDRSENETVVSKDDKHLRFYVSVRIVREADGLARVTTSTVVHLHNRLGKAYFTVIRPFHKLIVPSTLKNTLRRLSDK